MQYITHLLMFLGILGHTGTVQPMFQTGIPANTMTITNLIGLEISSSTATSSGGTVRSITEQEFRDAIVDDKGACIGHISDSFRKAYASRIASTTRECGVYIQFSK